MSDAEYLLIKAVLGLSSSGDVETQLFLFFDASIVHSERIRSLGLKNPRGLYVKDYGDRVEYDVKKPDTVKQATEIEFSRALIKGVERDY